MPEPLLYLKAFLAAALVAAVGEFAASRWIRSNSAQLRPWLRELIAFAAGAAGVIVSNVTVRWPPTTALDRFITLVLPAALILEIVIGWRKPSRVVANVTRLLFVLIASRILLHGSVYLQTNPPATSLLRIVVELTVLSAVLVGSRELLIELARRSSQTLVSSSLVAATVAAGGLIMLGGYVAGGALAFPLAGAMFGVLCVPVPPQRETEGLISLFLMALFGLLFIGRFFGGLSTAEAFGTLLAPLAAWSSTVVPGRFSRLRGAIGLVMALVPLAVLLALAKRRFDAELGPLL